jgi:menaquinone-9 beta-reductase
MIKKDVIIVGGGPAGSSCAWRLVQNGVSCLILDQKVFPRFKPCAGWVTPELVGDLELDIAAYPHSFTTFTSFEIAIRSLQFKLPTFQHAIRRFEFDDFLLKRSKAPVIQHTVRTIIEEKDGFTIDGEFSGTYLIGAGGTHCPVNRQLFQPPVPRKQADLIVALEDEFIYPYKDERCMLWFLQNNLPGYAWYVPKANGYLNVGIGGKEVTLKANHDSIKNHWNLLVQKLDEMGLVQGYEYNPSGHSYYLHQDRKEIRRGNAFIVGDSLGLATKDMGEGIHPAVKSGLLAADAILRGKVYSLKSISKYSFRSILGHTFSQHK